MNRTTPTRSIPNARMIDTINAMRRLAQEGKKDLEVRRLVEQLNAQVAEGDYASELLAIYYWVKQNVRYMRDIAGVEFLKTPRQLLETKSGDCDDIATLLAAMFMAAGNSVQFSIASFQPGMPAFSHVFVEVLTPWGPVVFDPVANRVTDEMLQNMKHKQSFPVAAGAMGAGVGALGQAVHVGSFGGNVYSVYDYHRGLYDYFEGPPRQLPATGRFRKPATSSRFGTAPEALAATLPVTAKKIGSGPLPRGLIAARNGVIMGAFRMPSPGTLTTLAVGAALGVLLYKYVGVRRGAR